MLQILGEIMRDLMIDLIFYLGLTIAILMLAVGVFEKLHPAQAQEDSAGTMSEYTGQKILRQLDRIESKIDQLKER